MKAFGVNIIGLRLKTHHFDFELGDGFFKEYGTDLVSEGTFNAEVVLTKKETFIEAHFKINGKAGLICDRCLEPFDFPVHIDKHLIFKYGEEETEMSDEIVVIRSDRDTLDMGQYLYEYIVLEIPMKKLHPKFENDDDEEEDTTGKMVYSSAPETDSAAGDIDPRWEQLKKLK